MTFAACKKETIDVNVPTQEDAYWYIYLDGQPSDPFRLVFSANYPPYDATWEYTNILCCNISPILVKMQLGKAYTISYMGRDAIMHTIFKAPTEIKNYRDTIPATTY
jgi:hypothetical protein